MKRLLHTLPYLLADAIAAYVVWLAVWVYRKRYIELDATPLHLTATEYILPAAFMLGWLAVYWLAGLYHPMHRRSLLHEQWRLLQLSAVGVLAVSFATFLNDPLGHPEQLRGLVLKFLAAHYGLTGLARFIITTAIQRRIARGKTGYSTLVIGSGPAAVGLWQQLAGARRKQGFYFAGYLPLEGGSAEASGFSGKLKYLGSLADLEKIIQQRHIERVVLAVDDHGQPHITGLLRRLSGLRLHIFALPGMYDLLVGNVKLYSSLADTPLVEIYPSLMAPWEVVAKRAMDIVVSIITLIVMAPVFGVLAVLVRLDSRGPVFYRQERIGLYGRPFRIIKFRSMRVDAETAGPALSSGDADPRITRMGRYLRKTRLDEFPQFWNVLRGDMSLVGPRPERQFFIDQIIRRAPEYTLLHKVRPGITSLGQVKYGYAENVDQMIERLKFDILYIENMSLALDFKILLYTVQTVLMARGK